MSAESHQFLGDVFRVEHGINDASLDRCLRHPAIFRRGRLLRDRQPAGRFHRRQPERAVASCPRQNDAYRLALALVGERL